MGRANFPYASDEAVFDVFNATKSWLTAHGYVFMQDEIFGLLTEVDENLNTSVSPIMYGTGPVYYGVRVGSSTLVDCVDKEALNTLGTAEQGLFAYYAAPYLKIENGRNSRAISGQVHFATKRTENSRDGEVTYDIFVDRSGEVTSFFNDSNHRPAPNDIVEPELKTNEQEALMGVIRGLGSITTRSRFRRGFWW